MEHNHAVSNVMIIKAHAGTQLNQAVKAGYRVFSWLDGSMSSATSVNVDVVKASICTAITFTSLL